MVLDSVEAKGAGTSTLKFFNLITKIPFRTYVRTLYLISYALSSTMSKFFLNFISLSTLNSPLFISSRQNLSFSSQNQRAITNFNNSFI